MPSAGSVVAGRALSMVAMGGVALRVDRFFAVKARCCRRRPTGGALWAAEALTGLRCMQGFMDAWRIARQAVLLGPGPA